MPRKSLCIQGVGVVQCMCDREARADLTRLRRDFGGWTTVPMGLGFPGKADEWLAQRAPHHSVVVSTRARLARNFVRTPFAPYAEDDQLERVAAQTAEAFENEAALTDFVGFPLASLETDERSFLRESFLISREMERGGVGRIVYLNGDMDASVMVNEEDHLRLSALASGFRLQETYARIARIAEPVEARLPMAATDEFGYLTACPTNTGTGLRLSVMLHLPALAMISQIQETLSSLGNYGLTVRGGAGEHSENFGDLYQVSNEVTLGKSESQIVALIEEIVLQIIRKELNAREVLFRAAPARLEDAVCRAMGVLSMVRNIDAIESVSMLSRTRLGIGREWGVPLTHAHLNRLFVDVMPAHLQMKRSSADTPNDRDRVRAAFLREIFHNGGDGGRRK